MDIDARKMALIEWLINLQDVNLLNKLESFFRQNQPADHSLTHDQIAGLDHALTQIEKGEVLIGEEARNRIKEKFNI